LTVDEYGGVTGLVTMEDLLECIFGEIHSPSDVSPKTYIRQLDNGDFCIDGAMTISDLNSEIGSELSDEQAETIGGLVLHEFGELPQEQEKIQIDGLHIEVTEVEDNRIKELYMKKIIEENMAEEDKQDKEEID
jgi:magnesium and cobalt transporter